MGHLQIKTQTQFTNIKKQKQNQAWEPPDLFSSHILVLCKAGLA